MRPSATTLYNNRLVVAVDADSGALILFEADFAVGTRVQLMDIDPQRMIDSAREQTEQLLARIWGMSRRCSVSTSTALAERWPFMASMRKSLLPVRTLIGQHCPLLGFFSGVEIAPIRGRSRPLDWTGVLALFTLT